MGQAQAALATPYHNIVNDVEAPLQRGMSDQTMARFKARTLIMQSGARGQSDVSSSSRAPLSLLLAVTAYVLLIACANIANLLLARAASRAGEMAVRLSIGAGRRQLIRQLLGESCLLALFGGVAGILVAYWTLALITAILPKEIVDTITPRLDGVAILFAAGLTITTGLLFGLFPALHSTRPDLVTALKGTAGQPSGARSASRFRMTLATVQIALSMALLVSAGLFAKSLTNVSRVQLGLKADNIVMFAVSPALNGYTPVRTKQLFEQVEDTARPRRQRRDRGSVALLSGNNWGNNVAVEGFQAGPDTDGNSAST